MKRSAGVLLYRRTAGELEVLLIHPGGPYWMRKDRGAWQIPKGELGPDEQPEAAALREVEEELGVSLTGPLQPLGEIRQAGGKLVTAFAIERGTPGFEGGRKEDKLGMRASETTEMIFTDCRVHESNMLGKEGEGFIQAMKVLDGGRISIAALSLGIAQGAYEAALAYSKERHQFNKPISEFQGIAFKLADMATEIEAASLLTYRAADMKNKGLNVTKESAFAKYYASEVSVRCATEGVQIFGGYGYTKDYPAEKYYRDSKLCTIGEGTSEIQKLVISRAILK